MRVAGRPSSSASAPKPGASQARTSLRASTSSRPSATTCSVQGMSAPREPLRPDVKRLEQVRLAGAVRPDEKHQTRLELELEPRVRPDVAQGNRANYQPG